MITAAVDTLPAAVDEATRHAAEATLVAEAGRFTPTRLTRLPSACTPRWTPTAPNPTTATGPTPATSWTCGPTGRSTGRSGSTRPSVRSYGP